MPTAVPRAGPACARRGTRPAAALTGLVLAATLILVPAARAEAASPNGPEQRGIALVNGERAARGLAPLTVHAGLTADARAWSARMAAEWRLAHDPDLRGQTNRLLPDWRRAAENIGYGPDVDHVVRALMGSPGHRANMLADHDAIGVGVVHRDGRAWVTMRFVSSPSVAVGPTVAGFRDVPARAYFAAGVSWMRERGITTGVGGADRFAPRDPVTRAQVGAFLHRMMGTPPGRAVPFADVAPGSYFHDAVGWLRAEGITNGVGSSGRYLPHRPVSRAEVAAFLWRLAGSPAAGTGHGFADVPRGHFAAEAVTWMAGHGITTGVGGSHRFAPEAAVDRAQVATLLHRLATTPAAWAPGASRP